MQQQLDYCWISGSYSPDYKSLTCWWRAGLQLALANLSIYNTWKNIKSEYKNNKFRISAQLGMILLIYLMVLIQFLIFRMILNLLLKDMKL